MKRIINKLYYVRVLIFQEGWLTLLRRITRYFFGFPSGKYFLYKRTTMKRDAGDFLPNIQDYEDFILHDKQEFEELEAKGFKFGLFKKSTLVALSNEAIVVCIFIDKELAHFGRLALTEHSKPYVDHQPYKINFENGEACSGSIWTLRKFRGKGLTKYGTFRQFEYLRERGITTVRNSIERTNTASQRAQAKFNPKIYAEAEFRKFLFYFQSWKETPLTSDQ